MLAEVELALGCGADNNQEFIKPRHWFEKVMISPSQSGGREVQALHSCQRRCYILQFKDEKIDGNQVSLVITINRLNTMQYFLLYKDLDASASL